MIPAITKSKITSYLRELETKFGMMVFTFGSDKPLPPGAIGFLDAIVIDGKNLIEWHIEVKVGDDDYSDRQKVTRDSLEKMETKLEEKYEFSPIRYMLITDENFVEMYTKLLTGGKMTAKIKTAS